MKEKHGLLYSFIKRKKEEYVEPASRGRCADGLSSMKHTISLATALTNMEHKKIAEQTKVSHGLIKKWRTEDLFKSIQEFHQKEFIELFIQETQRAFNDWLIDPKKGNDEFDFLISDCMGYGRELGAKLLSSLKEAFKEEPELNFFILKIAQANLVGCKKGMKKKALTDFFEEQNRELLIGTIDFRIKKFVEYLKKPNPSEVEKKVAVLAMQDFGEMLKDVLKVKK